MPATRARKFLGPKAGPGGRGAVGAGPDLCPATLAHHRV